MKKKIFTIISAALITVLLTQVPVFAAIGDGGYEGGISTWNSDGKTAMNYKEVCFLTGEPIVFEGDLIVKTTARQNLVTTTYSYALKNTKNPTDTLKRALTLTIKKTQGDNNRTLEETTISKPSEVIKIGSNTYTLKSYSLTKTGGSEDKPAVDYYSGVISSEKVYQIGTSTTDSITVKTDGNIYTYDQLWGSAEAQKLFQTIEAVQVVNGGTVKSGGTASVNISSGTEKDMTYQENEPQVISFEGGFVQSQKNVSVLEYTAKLTDTNGYINEYSDTLRQDSPIIKKMYIAPSIYQLKGHWSEQYVRELYSLGILDKAPESFNPDEYITKGEFISSMVNAINNTASKTTTTTTSTTTGKKPPVTSPFTDLDVNNKDFNNINNALKMGLINGKGDGTLGTNDYLIMADTLTIFVNALGLEGLAPGENPVTYFKDNDSIPQYARRPAYIAQKIGLIKGDNNGYLNPNSYITRAQAATLISRFLEYLRQDIRKDYKDRIVGYVG